MLLLPEGIGEEAVYRHVLRIVGSRGLPAASRREIRVALDASRPGTLQFGYEAGLDAGLRGEDLLERAAAIFLLASAVNVGDDLSDGDCAYLADARRAGPCVQAMLRNLFYSVVLEAGVPRPALAATVRDLIAAVAAQRLELATRRWDVGRFRRVADGIGGRLFSAYLRVLWADTSLAPRAAPVGRHVGQALVVAEDIESRDVRYASLSARDRRAVRTWALRAVDALHREGLRSIELLLRPIEPTLGRRPPGGAGNRRGAPRAPPRSGSAPASPDRRRRARSCA